MAGFKRSQVNKGHMFNGQPLPTQVSRPPRLCTSRDLLKTGTERGEHGNTQGVVTEWMSQGQLRHVGMKAGVIKEGFDEGAVAGGRETLSAGVNA